ncbi:Zinc/iron permease [Myxozyma melibiosi]|uniref:Zinc/iron permease n=1 Tax=Myxozyma melibiosi TaxID=54550 RepID=A0ABR1FF73_9ASCO
MFHTSSCEQEPVEEYVLSRRIISVFAVLLVSAVAVFFPFMLQHYIRAGDKSKEATKQLLIVLKQFGAGVIVATAFVHLLPDAFAAFQNPCIGEIKFDAWPGFLAMIGVMLTFMIENAGHRIVSEQIRRTKLRLTKRSGDATDGDSDHAPLLPTQSTEDLENHELSAELIVNQRLTGSGGEEGQTHSHSHHLHGHSHGHGLPVQDGTHVHIHGHTFYEIASDESDDELGEDGTLQQGAVSKELNAAIERLSLYVLEAGVIFHSVLIGITLSVTNESAWVSLFTVVMFHQFFEGMALGTRIMSVRSLAMQKKQRLCAWFCLITPIGMTVGIIIRMRSSGSSATTSPTALWATGTLNSLSAGILLWVSLVELLAEEWIHGELHEASLPLSISAFLAAIFGAGLMTVLGVWL